MVPDNCYKATLVPIGVHHAPEGKVVVTPKRVKHWVESFNKLKQGGIHFPTPWGHQLAAIPADNHEARKQAYAQWNAGYIEKLEQDPETGGLVAYQTIPPGYELDKNGDLINKTTSTRIRELSAGIGNWRDGRGQWHKDIILHSALVPFPVVGGQKGFSPATLATDSTQLLTLSTDNAQVLFTFATKIGGFSMATEDDDKKKKGPPVPLKPQDADDSDVGDGDGDEGVDDAEIDPELEELTVNPTDDEPTVTPDDTPETPLSQTIDQSNKLIAILRSMGLNLQDDTNDKNLLDRLLTGFSILQNQGITLTPKSSGPDDTTTKIDTSIPDDATPGQPGMGSVMMSTLTGKPIQLQGESSRMAHKLGNDYRKELKAKWKKLRRRGILPQSVVEQECMFLDQANLSFDPENLVVGCPEGERRLEFAQEIAKHVIKSGLMSSLATSITNPVELSGDEKKEVEAIKEATVVYERVTGKKIKAK